MAQASALKTPGVVSCGPGGRTEGNTGIGFEKAKRRIETMCHVQQHSHLIHVPQTCMIEYDGDDDDDDEARQRLCDI